MCNTQPCSVGRLNPVTQLCQARHTFFPAMPALGAVALARLQLLLAQCMGPCSSTPCSASISSAATCKVASLAGAMLPYTPAK